MHCVQVELLLLFYYYYTYRSWHYVVLVWVSFHIVCCLSSILMITNDYISYVHCQHVRATGHH